MARPALATVSVLAIVTSWNNFMLPLVVFSDQSWWTLPARRPGSSRASTPTTPPGSSPTSSLSMVPALGFYAVAERQLIGGLTGSVKG